MPPPGRDESSSEEPEKAIDGLEMRTRTRAEGDVELVAQEEVLDDEVVAVPEEGAQGGEEGSEQFKHFVRVADSAGPSFCPPTTVSGRTRMRCRLQPW
jgi:hypothetical protein